MCCPLKRVGIFLHTVHLTAAISIITENTSKCWSSRQCEGSPWGLSSLYARDRPACFQRMEEGTSVRLARSLPDGCREAAAAAFMCFRTFLISFSFGDCLLSKVTAMHLGGRFESNRNKNSFIGVGKRHFVRSHHSQHSAVCPNTRGAAVLENCTRGTRLDSKMSLAALAGGLGLIMCIAEAHSATPQR